MHIFADMTHLMTFLVKFSYIDPLEFSFRIWEEKFFYHFSKILTYDVNLAPKIEAIWRIFTKMTYFDKIYPINDIFDQIYVHKPDWNNF